MSKCKVAVQLTGSIACYKTCHLVSRLVQEGYEVQVIMTEAALKFVGATTFEALTGRPVLSDMWAKRQMMEHIETTKWADLFVLAPATANTINRLANGLADDLVGSLFLANNFQKPYWIAPAMNTQMFKHPATQRGMAQLKEWGVCFFETEIGRLACGDVGEGKMIDPDRIFEKIAKEFPSEGRE